MKKEVDSKKKLFENMVKLNPDFKLKEVINEEKKSEVVAEEKKEVIAEDKKKVLAEDKKWIQKAVNPEHKGYCTPMTKSTCTPARKALAKRFKKGIEDESYGTADPLGTNMAKPVKEGLNEIASSSPIGKFVLFGYNYPPDFIEQVWADEPNMMNHLKEKFKYYYDKFGADAVMNRFFIELDDSNQRKLEDWIAANYKG
jgi:hypothetical protein